MPIRRANAVWNGNLKDGNGKLSLGSGAFEGNYSFLSRFDNGTGTNPEELIGAAHAGCFSMAFSHMLAENGFEPKSVSTKAEVKFEKEESGFVIKQITLITEADIPNIDETKFLKFAEDAKNGCPVSKALKAVDIKLEAKLLSAA
ncbi:MAG: OsmC family protein [candidate division Zixibacteria bacterium]|nr:OsmC family protein [candidate division Zixibacteria bacterium]